MRMFKVFLPLLMSLVYFVAWSFGIVTLLAVCWMFTTCVQDADSHCTMMSNGVTHAWGLTYTSRQGAVLALVECVLVAGALWASKTRTLACRSIGHSILILWAGLWMANAFYVFAHGTFGLIYCLPFCFLCTCLRAARDLRRATAWN